MYAQSIDENAAFSKHVLAEAKNRASNERGDCL